MARVFPTDHPEAESGSAHIIFAREGAAMVRAFKAAAEQGQPEISWNSITFHADAIKLLLEQEGVEGITLQHAIHKDEHTLVAFGVNSQGQIVGSMAIENGQRCPPFC